MERVGRRQDLESSLLVPKSAGEFIQAFVGLRAGVAEEHAPRGKMPHDGAGQVRLGGLVVEVGDMHQPARLLHQGLGDLGVGMAQRAHGDAAPEVDVTAAGDVPHNAARAVAQGQVEAPVAGHHMLLEQGLHLRVLVANDGRGPGDEVFHQGRELTVQRLGL